MKLIQKTDRAVSLVSFLIKASLNDDRTPESLVDLAFSCNVVAPLQVRSELIEFARFVQERRPKALLEIGTSAGGTFFVLSRLAAPDALVISLDLPGGRFGGGYASYRIPLMHRLKQPGQQLHLLRADSHSPETAQRLARILGDRKLNFLLIDGDHTYEGVKGDFEMYSPFVGPGGVIAFHDVVEHPNGTDCEVDRLWREIRGRYPSREIIQDRRQGTCGIGVIFV